VSCAPSLPFSRGFSHVPARRLLVTLAPHSVRTATLATSREAVGSTDGDFLHGLTKQLVNAGTQGPKADEDGTNFMLAVVKGIEPKDQVEAMLGVQMAAVHNATMTFARHLAHAEIIMQQDSAENAFNKLARTFAAQVEALPQRRRAKDDGSACPRRRGWAGGRRQRQRSGRGGRAAEKIGDSTPCSCICTWRRDATPNRSGAGYSAGRRRFGDARGRWRRSEG
jgi:hypothetical protein